MLIEPPLSPAAERMSEHARSVAGIPLLVDRRTADQFREWLHGQCSNALHVPGAPATRSLPAPVPPLPFNEKKPMRSATVIGEPCIHGHDGVRYVQTGNCVECRRIYGQNYEHSRDRPPRSEEAIRADLVVMLTEQLTRQHARWGFL